jgi:hypothetical protein
MALELERILEGMDRRLIEILSQNFPAGAEE